MFLLLENGNYLLLEDGGRIILDTYTPPEALTRPVSFATTTLLSYYQWLDNWLLQNNAAYTNVTTQLYYQPDSRLSNTKVAYAAPFKSMVWDAGVTGAQILSSVSGSIGTVSRGGPESMTVDFENGRVIMNASVGPSAIVSGSYAFKDFNLYFANQSQEDIVFTNKYQLNSRFARPASVPPTPHAMTTPCIFISNNFNENKNFAFGGLYNTSMTIGLTVLAETLAQLESVMSVILDSKQQSFPALSALWPLQFNGDYKGAGYNYETIKVQYGQPSNLYTIHDVRASKVGDGVKINQSVFVGLIDVTVQKVRGIR
jgi:hypothetical protein